MNSVLNVIVRVVGMVAIAWVAGQLVILSSGDDSGANIGAGLISLLVMIAASFAWALLDGRRWRDRRQTLLTWLVVAVLSAVVMVFQMQTIRELDTAVLGHDLISMGPFLFGLMAVPAMVGGLAGHQMSPPPNR